MATGTQSQALNALVFLYDEVLEEDLGEIGEFKRGKAPKRLPEVLAKSEVRAVLTAQPCFRLRCIRSYAASFKEGL